MFHGLLIVDSCRVEAGSSFVRNVEEANPFLISAKHSGKSRAFQVEKASRTRGDENI